MGISRVQAPAIASNSASGANITNTFGSNVTAGSLLLAFGTSSPAQTQTFSSTGSPTWTKIAQFTDTGGSGAAIAIAYCLSAPAGATTVTLTYATSTGFRALVIAEYSWGGATGALDKSTPGLTTGLVTNPTDSAMVTTANGDLIVSCLVFRNATRPASAGSGFSAISIDNATCNFGAEDQIQATAGSIAPSWTLTTGSAASAIMSAAFKAATVTGRPSPARRISQLEPAGAGASFGR